MRKLIIAASLFCAPIIANADETAEVVPGTILEVQADGSILVYNEEVTVPDDEAIVVVIDRHEEVAKK